MAERGVFVGRQRNPWLMALLSLVTALLFFLYWLYAVNTEVRRRTGRKVRAEWLLVLALVFPVGTALAVWRTARHVRALQYEVASTREARPSLLGGLSLLVPLVGELVAVVNLQGSLNDVWRMTREGIEAGPSAQDLRCPSCDALFTVSRAPFLPFHVSCPSCSMEGAI